MFMRNLCFGRLAALGLAGLIICSACMALVAQVQPDLERMQEEFDRFNYRQAGDLAREFLKRREPGPEFRSKAQRILAICLLMLDDPEGYAMAGQLMSEQPALADDPVMWGAMGRNQRNANRYKEAYEHYLKAAELFEARANFIQAARAYLESAAMLQSGDSILPAQAELNDWHQRRRLARDRAVEICDHVAEMEIPAGIQAEALIFAASVSAEEGSWDYASRGIERLERAGELEDKPSAAKAMYEAGMLYERFARYVQAVESFERVIKLQADPRLSGLAQKAAERIEVPHISLSVSGPFLPRSRPVISWSVRNVRSLELSAYRVDLLKVPPKLSNTRELIDALKAISAQPVACWNFKTPDDGTHQYHSYDGGSDQPQLTEPIRPPLEDSSAYLITADGLSADGRKASGSCLLVISQLAAVTKIGQDQAAVFVADAVTGQAVEGADVVLGGYGHRRNLPTLAASSKPLLVSGKTDNTGLVVLKLPQLDELNVIITAGRGDDQAVCGPGWRWWRPAAEEDRLYGFTDRPVYRPGDRVNFKQVLRKYRDGEYHNAPDKKLKVEIVDPRNQTIYSADHSTDRFGATTGQFVLGEDVPLGLYSIRVKSESDWLWSEGNRFRVEEYRKPEFEVTVEPGQDNYRVGESMRIAIAAAYYFGQPVVGADVKFTIRKQSYTPYYDWPSPWPWLDRKIGWAENAPHMRMWWPGSFLDELAVTGTAVTDSQGRAYVVLPAEPFAGHEDKDLRYIVEAEVSQASGQTVVARGEIKVTHTPFFVFLKPARAVYAPGDGVEILIRAQDPNAKPVCGKFKAEVWKIRRVGVDTEVDSNEKFEDRLEQLIHSETFEIPQTGRATMRFTPDVAGHIRVIVRQADVAEEQSTVRGQADLWIAPPKGTRIHYAFSGLELVPSDDQVEPGSVLRVLVNTAYPGADVLLTAEAENLLMAQVVHMEGNSTLVEIPVAQLHSPNFSLKAVLLADNRLCADSKTIFVPATDQLLNVELHAAPGDLGGGGGKDPTYQPRERTTVRVRLTNRHTGEGVEGQLALYAVDSSIYYIQPEFRLPIEQVFYGQSRPDMVQTLDSFAGGAYGGGEVLQEKEMLLAGAAGAPMRQSQMDMAKAGPAELTLIEPVVREFFRDSILWAGTVQTDADGMAEVPIEFPDQLTNFALHAVAIDEKARVGQARLDVKTAKNIIVRLQSGRFFTQGDKSWVTLVAHNYFDQPQELVIDLSADGLVIDQARLGDGEWQKYQSGQELSATVPAGGQVRMDVMTSADSAGLAVLLARAKGARESDAVKITLPILPWGAKRLTASGGALIGPADQPERQKNTWNFSIPREIQTASAGLTVALSPSPAVVAMEALPFLADYPYGCVEQTMSRFLPAVVVHKTLQQAGVDLEQIMERIELQSAGDPKLSARWEHIRSRLGRNPLANRSELDRMIRAGLRRLSEMQNADGSWGWWKGENGNPYMTAHVVYGLAMAREADVTLPEGMIERATDWLVNQAQLPPLDQDHDWRRRHLWEDNTRAYMLFSIGQANPSYLQDDKLSAELERLYARRDDFTDQGRALLALAIWQAGKDQQARIVVENFYNTARIDDRLGQVHWGKTDGWWYWFDSPLETTAWVLQAMLSVCPDHPHVPMAANWLAANRRQVDWGNTKTTTTVVYALVRYAQQAGQFTPDQSITILLDGREIHRVKITAENMFTFDSIAVVPAELLASGEHVLTISREGKGSLYWNAYLEYVSTAERIEGAGAGLAIRRSYYRLVPEQFINTRRVWENQKWGTETFPDIRYARRELQFGEELASGELIESKLDILAENNLEYMVFEDPKPAGCEPVELHSGYSSGPMGHVEYRDALVAMFASFLHQGEHTVTHRLRCQQPGTFRILPAAGEAMYSPFVEANSQSGNLTITQRPAE